MVREFDFSTPNNFIKGLQQNGVMVFTAGGEFKTSPNVSTDESVYMYIKGNEAELVSIVKGGFTK